MDTLSRPDAPPTREPRTFELRDGEWAETAPERRRQHRLLPWLLVPAVLVALTGIILILFAAIAAAATGGLVALRSAVLDRGAQLGERLKRFLGR